MEALRPVADEIGKATRIDDAKGRYIMFQKNTFPKNYTLDDFRIVLDCANGATYGVAPTSSRNWAPTSASPSTATATA